MAEKIGRLIIAGAGTGKTYTMAHDIVSYLKNSNSSKKIYAITFTNNAKQNIVDEVYEILKYYPTNLEISTIHSFLLNNIIFPFSSFSINEIYSECSIANLPDKPQFRNSKIKQYKENKIIHSDVVVEKSRLIFCDKSTDSKKIKSKKKIVREHFYSDCEAIFIDEAQDMDKDFFDLIVQIRMDKLYTYIVGDVNQAVRKVGEFDAFINEFQHLYNVEINSQSRRCPLKHLQLSNNFIDVCYHQSSMSKIEGELNYLFESDSNFSFIFTKKNGLKFIRQKYGGFDTRSYSTESIEFIKPIENFLHSLGGDIDARRYELTQKILNYKNNGNSDQTIMNWLIKTAGISIDKKEYAIMISHISSVPIEKENSIISVEKVKGLGNETCFFVLDNTMYTRLINLKKIDDKINNQLYVALTRSKEELILVIPKELEIKHGKLSIIDSLKKLSISEYNLG